jgi:hypothetical protein
MFNITDHLLKSLKSVTQDLPFITNLKASLIKMYLLLLYPRVLHRFSLIEHVCLKIDVAVLDLTTLLQVHAKFLVFYKFLVLAHLLLRELLLC